MSDSVWVLEVYHTYLGEAGEVGESIDLSAKITHPNLPHAQSAYTSTLDGTTLVLYEDEYGSVLLWGDSQWEQYAAEQLNQAPTFVPEIEYIFLEEAADDGSPPTEYATGVRTIADTFSIDSSQSSWEFDVVSNDIFYSGATFESLTFEQPGHGTLSEGESGKLIYTPDIGFAGLDRFYYTVYDSNGASSSMYVSILAESDINRAPVAEDDYLEIAAGQLSTFFVWDNDYDPDVGDNIFLAAAMAGPDELMHPEEDGFIALLDGDVRLNEDGSVSFRPSPGFLGETFFVYEIRDDLGANDLGTVYLDVIEVLSSGTQAVDDMVGSPDREGDYYFFNVSDNDTIADGALQLDYISFTQPSVGQLETPSQISSGPLPEGGLGSFRYRPEPGFTGDVSFTYTIEDSEGTRDTGTVTINVSQNAPPVANFDPFRFVNDGGETSLVVLSNDQDEEKELLQITGFSEPDHGTAFLKRHA